MIITLINIIVYSIIFAVLLFVKNRLSKLRHDKIQDYKKIKVALRYLALCVIMGGVAWFLPRYQWLNIIASLFGLMGTSVFFNTIIAWFRNTQHHRMKKEDLLSVGLWCLWLLSISLFFATIMTVILN